MAILKESDILFFPVSLLAPNASNIPEKTEKNRDSVHLAT